MNYGNVFVHRILSEDAWSLFQHPIHILGLGYHIICLLWSRDNFKHLL